MYRLRIVLACLLLLGAAALATAGASGAGAAAGVTVTPSTHLVGGNVVHLVATGVTPMADVHIVQCDIFVGDGEHDCYGGGASTTADATGRVAVDVTLADPVYRMLGDEGDARPIYCRSQVCRLFVAWNDAAGDQQVLQSGLLAFRGAPAVIVVTPNSHLAASQVVSVHGSAHGAKGHRVRIFEETCYAIIQGHGCTQQYPTKTVTVDSKGFYWVRYRIHRYLPDGRDCTNDDVMFPEYCQLTTVVLSHGRPDYSFGDPTWGDPHGALYFASGPAGGRA